MTPTGPWSQPAARTETGERQALPGAHLLRRISSNPIWLAAFLGLLGLGACGPEPEPAVLPEGLVLTAYDFERLPGWADDRVSQAVPALRKSCERTLARSGGMAVGPGQLAGTVNDWREACEAVLELADNDEGGARTVLQAHFAPFRAENRSGESGIFTGYYEAGLKGARTPDETYRWPVYGKPDDLVSIDLKAFQAAAERGVLVGRVDAGKVVPYFSRAEIDRGALSDRGLEVLWVDDPIDAFFLHIQGSGQVKMRSGETVRVGYAASNGHQFYAIGRALLDEGLVPRNQASMQGIRAWLKDNPGDADAMMQRNKRYIFFRELDGDGPVGAQGVSLTAGRSLAVDPAFIPYGAPVWLDTTWPDGSARPLQRLMVAQDTGNAIKGPVRGDFYWGTGPEAAAYAGRMKQKGTYFLFLPRRIAERRGAGS